MSARHTGRRRVGLRVVLGACSAALILAALVAAYGYEPGYSAPGAVTLPPLPAATSIAYESHGSVGSVGSVGTLAGSTSPAPSRIGNGSSSAYAPLIRATEALAAPSSGARVVAHLSSRTPEGTTTIVPVFRRAERGGSSWLEVGLPVLPNGTKGWVPRTALGGYGFVSTRLEISRAKLRAVLYRGTAKVFSAPIGVGRGPWPTPAGRFIVRNRLTKYASATYGPVAFGTSARSAVLTDWPAGGFIGIHGTNQPALIPGRISHGCIRLRNGDIVRLERLMPIGTTVVIR